MERNDIDTRLDKLDASKIEPEHLKACLALLETRNNMELERAQGLDTKGAALLAGLLALVGFLFAASRTWWLLLVSALMFVPMVVLVSSLRAQDFSIAPPLESVLDSLEKDNQAKGQIRAMTTFAKAIFDNRKLVDVKADRINQALLLGSVVLPIILATVIFVLYLSHDSTHCLSNFRPALDWNAGFRR